MGITEPKNNLSNEDVIDVLSMIQRSIPYTKADDEEADILERSLSTAIAIMRKYQKIEQIVADRKGKLILNTLVAIIKVVENGNVD